MRTRHMGIVAAVILLLTGAGLAYQIGMESASMFPRPAGPAEAQLHLQSHEAASLAKEKDIAGAGIVLMENFDVDVFPPVNWGTAIVQGSTQGWIRVTSGAQPPCTPFGAGMLMFSSYAMSAGDSTRLFSPVLNLTGQTAPVLEFRMYHDIGSPSNYDRISVEISTNGGASYAPALATIPRYDGTNGWKIHTVDLSAYIGQTNVRIAFLGISDFGNNMYLDTVKVGDPTVLFKVYFPAIAVPPPPPPNGGWSGITNRSQPMSFEVYDAGTKWRNIYLKTDYIIGLCIGTLEFGATGPGTISSSQFSVSSGNFSFTAQLNSPTTASGSYAITNQVITGCGTLNQSGTWSAHLP